MNFKKAFTLFAAGIMTAGMIAGTGVPAMAAEKIGEAAAEEIALDDAGLTRNDVTFDRTEAGTEHGAAVYEIEFRTSSKEYDYDISMADGEIVSRGYDLRNPSARKRRNRSHLRTQVSVRAMPTSLRSRTAQKTEFRYSRSSSRMQRESSTMMWPRQAARSSTTLKR